MKNFFEKSLWVVACLALILLCTTACDQGKVEKVRKAAGTVTRILSIAQTVLGELQQEKVLEPDEATQLADHLSHVKDALTQFNQAAARFQENPESKAELLRTLAEVSRQAEALHENGVLRVKNPRAREKLSRTLAGARISLEVIAVTIETG